MEVRPSEAWGKAGQFAAPSSQSLVVGEPPPCAQASVLSLILNHNGMPGVNVSKSQKS